MCLIDNNFIINNNNRMNIHINQSNNHSYLDPLDPLTPLLPWRGDLSPCSALNDSSNLFN